jgi:tryptophan-rich sensory protein
MFINFSLILKNTMTIASFLIPACVVLTALIGSKFTASGMKWYEQIQKPTWTPSGRVIGTIWTVIFLLTAGSALLAWEATSGIDKLLIVGLYLTNLILNLLWSYIFFREHQMSIATIEAGALCLSVLAIMIAVWSSSVTAALFLLPYFLWTGFATYLTRRVWKLNTNWKWSSI